MYDDKMIASYTNISELPYFLICRVGLIQGALLWGRLPYGTPLSPICWEILWVRVGNHFIHQYSLQCFSVLLTCSSPYSLWITIDSFTTQCISWASLCKLPHCIICKNWLNSLVNVSKHNIQVSSCMGFSLFACHICNTWQRFGSRLCVSVCFHQLCDANKNKQTWQ